MSSYGELSMPAEKSDKKSGKVLSRTGIMLGAAGLLMFIVGLKRSYHLDEEHSVGEPETAKRRKKAGD
jgi:hypothetical protein